MANEIGLALWNRAGNQFLVDLDNAFDIQWQDVLNDVGLGKFTIALNDLAVPWIEIGCLVRCRYRTNTEAFSWRVENITWVRVSPDEEYGQVVEVSGRGKGSRFGYSKIYPPKGVNEQHVIESRSISFASAEYDDTNWTAATHVAAFGDMNSEWKGVLKGVLVPAPFAWPTLPYATFWIWPSLSQAVGTCYFRQTFALATAQQVTIIASADNYWTLYLDGTALIGDSTLPTAWQEHRQWQGTLEPGVHQLAAVVQNLGGVAGFICAVYIENDPICDQEDPPNCVESDPTVLLVSDYYWKCLAYPVIEPGYTPAYFILQVLNEAKSRGQLLDIWPTFSSTFDSYGNAWEVMPEVGANIGDSILDALQGLVATQWAEWELSPVEAFAPAGFQAVYQAPNVVLTWQHPGSGAPTQYEIHRGGWLESGEVEHYWTTVSGATVTVTDTDPPAGIVATYILYPITDGVMAGGITTTVSIPPTAPIITMYLRDATHPTYVKLSWRAGILAVMPGYDVEWRVPAGSPAAFTRIASNMIAGTIANVPAGFLWNSIPPASSGGGCWAGPTALPIEMRVRAVTSTGVSAWVVTVVELAPPVEIGTELHHQSPQGPIWWAWDCPMHPASFDVEYLGQNTGFLWVRLYTGQLPGTIVVPQGSGMAAPPWIGPAVPANGGGCWAPTPPPGQTYQFQARSVGSDGSMSQWQANEAGGVYL